MPDYVSEDFPAIARHLKDIREQRVREIDGAPAISSTPEPIEHVADDFTAIAKQWREVREDIATTHGIAVKQDGAITPLTPAEKSDPNQGDEIAYAKFGV